MNNMPVQYDIYNMCITNLKDLYYIVSFKLIVIRRKTIGEETKKNR